MTRARKMLGHRQVGGVASLAARALQEGRSQLMHALEESTADVSGLVWSSPSRW